MPMYKCVFELENALTSGALATKMLIYSKGKLQPRIDNVGALPTGPIFKHIPSVSFEARTSRKWIAMDSNKMCIIVAIG